MNYILFYPDEMRAESLSCYGHPLTETPNLDRLAAEGTVFRKNYTQHPVCTASRCALVTGLYPHINGFRSLKHYLTKDDHSLVRDLRDAGFTTCFGGKSDCFDEEGTAHAYSRVQPGINWRFFDVRGAKDLYNKMQENPPEPEEKSYTMLLPPIAEGKPLEQETGDAELVAWACGEIEQLKDEKDPFFMMVALHNPHPAYHAPARYHDKYDPDNLPQLRSREWFESKPEFYQLIREYRELGDPEDEVFKKINSVYLGMISYCDELLGRIMDKLEECGIYDDTTIIICSDHGDFSGDAGLVEKWPSAMDDMLTRVPLIFRRPGCPGGLVVDTPTQSIDILPTIMDWENVEASQPHYGVSLAGQVGGAPGDEGRAVYCEGGYDTNEMHCFEGTPLFSMHLVEGRMYYPKMMQQQNLPDSVCRVIMQRDNRYKLNVRTNGQNELYDMETDPGEYKNLYNDSAHKDLRDSLTLKMLTWLIHSSDITPYEGHIVKD